MFNIKNLDFNSLNKFSNWKARWQDDGILIGFIRAGD